VTIKIAIESNPNMLNIENLIGEFYKLYPGIKVDFDTLNENNERALVETDVSTHANEFNAVMISNYETPIWAKNGWLQNLTPALTADKSYDINDLLKPIRASLTYKGGLYSVPFYGESSMLYYRKSILAAAGETMPLHPTWAQVAAIAAKVNTPSVVGRQPRGHGHDRQHVRRLVVQRQVAAAAHLDTGRAGVELLRQPDQGGRRVGRVAGQLPAMRDALRRGQDSDVV
jgi:sorbitol/mannitol transport system substrate-binding protein